MKTALSLIIGMLLTACASTPPQTLDQKLASKNAAERKETLRLACLNEAEWPIYNSSDYRSANPQLKTYIKSRYNAEVSEMKSLCNKMDDLTSSNAEKKLQPKELASQCAEKVAATIQKGHTEHAGRTKEICEKMTGKNVTVNTNKK